MAGQDERQVEERVRASFAKQGLMTTLGATLVDLAPGRVEIAFEPTSAISQQHGFVHAGALSAIADGAAGYAALSLMPPDQGVLTTEFKINFLEPAAGDRIRALGTVMKAGRTLTFAQAEVFAEADGHERLIAYFTATMMAVEGRAGIKD
ncbi:PaaI family thioesterase [Methylorubrum extorquens]|uniref:PaaI family thioesterase n=1 Tax=Methylorubrum extorquens TaxID=408 RepID=UPI00288B220D|nr:PaaI family thioesterase [Methylorubrum extorquens]